MQCALALSAFVWSFPARSWNSASGLGFRAIVQTAERMQFGILGQVFAELDFDMNGVLTLLYSAGHLGI